MKNQNPSNPIVSIQERYKDCNLLLPVSTEVQLNPFYKYTIMEVTADLKQGSGDIFKVGNVKVNEQWEDVFSPAKPLLMKLASAAGIQFDPNYTFGQYLTKNCYKAKAYGAMRMPDGTGKTHCDEKLINLDDEEDRFRLEFMDKSLEGITDTKQGKEAEKLFKGKWIDSVDKWNKPCKAYVIADVDRQKYIDRGVLVNMTLLRKTSPEKAMTGAILRVVRALIGLKGAYTLEELSKPFAIPRVTFSPDYNDPMVRAAMLEQGMGSVSNMFGGSHPAPSLSAPSDSIIGTIDTFIPDTFIEDNAGFISDNVNDEADEFPTQQPTENTPIVTQPFVTRGSTSESSLSCEMCGANISEKVAEYSMKKFRQPLCMNCQKEAL